MMSIVALLLPITHPVLQMATQIVKGDSALGFGWWFFTCGDKVLVIPQGQGLPFGEVRELPFPALDFETAEEFAEYQGEPCRRMELAEPIDMGIGEWLTLRESMFRLEPGLFDLVGRAQQIELFLNTHRFCGRCAEPMQRVDWELAVACPECGFRAYPRISPSIIVLVTKGDEVLLASHRRHKHGFYTAVAGFVEAGETLENAVVREVEEETGIRCHKLRYWKSQPWAFPHSLMAAYFAEYQDGDIQADRRELLDARWFKRDKLPDLPPHGTIARAMIERWREGK